MTLPTSWLPKLLLFSVIAAALIICCTPDVTWANLDYDVFDFMYSSTFLNVGHAAGFPLYTLLGWLAIKLPGNDAWSLALVLSVIPMLITCGLIFFIVARKTTQSWAPYVATAAFAGSQVVFSQAIIPEIYALLTMFMVGSYVLCEVGRPRLGMLAIGFGMCIHYLALLALPILVWKYLAPNLRTAWSNRYAAMWFLLPMLLYLYVPIANRAPHLSLGPNSLEAYEHYFLYHGNMIFSLPAWQLPERVGEGAMVVVGSLGVALLFGVLGLAMKVNRTLLWLALPGIAYYLTTLGPTAYVHMTPAFAFTAVAAGIAVDRVSIPVRKLAPIALLCSVALLGVNTYNYDIGRTLDPTPTGARQFLEALDEMPNRSVLVCWDAVTYAGVHYYNETHNPEREIYAIHPLFIDPLDAHQWELERYPELELNYGSAERAEIPPPSDDWLKNYNDWCLAHTAAFAVMNPHVTIYAALSNLEERERRGIWLVELE